MSMFPLAALGHPFESVSECDESPSAHPRDADEGDGRADDGSSEKGGESETEKSATATLTEASLLLAIGGSSTDAAAPSSAEPIAAIAVPSGCTSSPRERGRPRDGGSRVVRQVAPLEEPEGPAKGRTPSRTKGRLPLKKRFAKHESRDAPPGGAGAVTTGGANAIRDAKRAAQKKSSTARVARHRAKLRATAEGAERLNERARLENRKHHLKVKTLKLEIAVYETLLGAASTTQIPRSRAPRVLPPEEELRRMSIAEMRVWSRRQHSRKRNKEDSITSLEQRLSMLKDMRCLAKMDSTLSGPPPSGSNFKGEVAFYQTPRKVEDENVDMVRSDGGLH